MYMTVICVAASIVLVVFYVVFHGMEIHEFYFCPEVIPVAHGLGLEKRV